MNILKTTKGVIHGWLTKIHIISLGFLLRNLTCSFLVGKDCREISACSKGCGAWLLARNAWAGCPCFMFLCCGSMWKQLQFLQVLHVPTCVVHCRHVRKHFDLRNSILNIHLAGSDQVLAKEGGAMWFVKQWWKRREATSENSEVRVSFSHCFTELEKNSSVLRRGL